MSTKDKKRIYLGGTDMAAILGRSTWKTALDVFLVKTGRRPPVTQNESMTWGIVLEPVILAEYGKRTGLEIIKGDWLKLEGCDYLIGHPDAFSVDKAGNRRLLEVKTASAFSRKSWEQGIPFDYYCQAQFYLHLSGLHQATFIVLFGGQEMLTYDVEGDPIFQHDMISKAHEFYREYIEKDIPPTPSQWTSRASDQVASEGKEANDECKAYLRELLVAKKLRGDAEAREEAALNWLKTYAPTGKITVNGSEAAGWSSKSRKQTVLEAKTWTQFNTKPTATIASLLSEITLDAPPDIG